MSILKRYEVNREVNYLWAISKLNIIINKLLLRDYGTFVMKNSSCTYLKAGFSIQRFLFMIK